MEKKLLILFVLNSVLASILIFINFFLFKEFPTIFSAINIIAGFMFAFPPILFFYLKHKKRKEIETMFPIFLMDFVEAIRGGLTVPQAFKFVSSNDYRALTPYVKKWLLR